MPAESHRYFYEVQDSEEDIAKAQEAILHRVRKEDIELKLKVEELKEELALEEEKRKEKWRLSCRQLAEYDELLQAR